MCEVIYDIGDIVTWETANGKVPHTGTVIAVVHANCGAWPPVEYADARCQFEGWPRKHESYLVYVAGAGKRMGQVYWPRVSQLRREA